MKDQPVDVVGIFTVISFIFDWRNANIQLLELLANMLFIASVEHWTLLRLNVPYGKHKIFGVLEVNDINLRQPLSKVIENVLPSSTFP